MAKENDARSRIREVARSLAQSISEARSVEEAAQRIFVNGNESVSSAKKVRGTIDSVDAGIEQAGTSLQDLVKLQREVNQVTTDTLTGLETTSSGLQEMTASVNGVKKD